MAEQATNNIPNWKEVKKSKVFSDAELKHINRALMFAIANARMNYIKSGLIPSSWPVPDLNTEVKVLEVSDQIDAHKKFEVIRLIATIYGLTVFIDFVPERILGNIPDINEEIKNESKTIIDEKGRVMLRTIVMERIRQEREHNEEKLGKAPGNKGKKLVIIDDKKRYV